MTLYKLKSVPFVLIEDDYSKNILPLLLDMVGENSLHVLCYEKPVCFWRNVFKKRNVVFSEDLSFNCINVLKETKSTLVIDSINQMILSLGWNETLKFIKLLSIHKVQLVVILHKDGLFNSSKSQLHLNHMANAIISFDPNDNTKISVNFKKGPKSLKSEEILTYDRKNNFLKSSPISKNIEKIEEPEKPPPNTLSTFKIEVEQTEKLERYKLKLPYMSKINEGENKVFYEPDAVDDWDEEDPDDDLDI